MSNLLRFLFFSWGHYIDKYKNSLANQRLARLNVPGVGVEPTRIAPLVFETSASTGSAIRAAKCKDTISA
jgi:hypothetical protein